MRDVLPVPLRLRAGSAVFRASAKVVAWGLLFYAGVSFLGAYFVENATGSAVLQAVLAEWGAGRLGISWSDPDAKTPTFSAIARRAARGASIGLTAGVVVLGFALLTRAAWLAPNTPALAPIFLGLIVPAFVAMKEELLFRGLVLRVLPKETPGSIALVACGLSSAAAAVGAGAKSVPEILTAGLGGVAFAALWRRDRGARMAWGAHTAWLWAAQALARGGVIDLRAAETPWGGGDAGLGAGWAGVAAIGLLAGGAFVADVAAKKARMAST